MNPDDVAPIWLQAVALIVVLTPTIAFIAFRRSIGVMNAAAGLVIWGALLLVASTATGRCGSSIHERSWSDAHATVHYFMAGAYAAIAGVLLSVIALTLFREGRRSGWFAVLFALLVGGSLELVMNGPTGYLYHHIGLYGYPVAWAAALVIAYKPTFVGPRPIGP